MIYSLLFRLFSAFKSLRFHKYIAFFNIISYSLGLILPMLILSAAYQELSQLNHSFMKEADRIIHITDQSQLVPWATIKNKPNYSKRELIEHFNHFDEGIEDVFYYTEGLSYVTDYEHYRRVPIMYVNSSFAQHFTSFVTKGKWFDTVTEQCIIGSNLARKLWKENLNQEIRIAGSTCQIIGETEAYDYKVLQLSDDKEIPGGVTHYFIKVDKEVLLQDIIAKINQMGGQFSVETMKEANKRQLMQAYEAFTVLLLLSLIALLYSLFNINNMLGLMLNDRKRKFGIQLAMGSKQRGLYFEIYLELLVVTSLSVLLVYLILLSAESMIEHYLFPIRIEPVIMLLVISFNLIMCVLLTVLFGRRIFKNNIVQLIRGTE